MGNRFELQRYYSQYVEACTALSRAASRLENMKGSAVYYDDVEEFQATLAAAEEEYQAAKDKADELWYLANTGKPKPKHRETGIPDGLNFVLTTGGLSPASHWPEPSNPGRLPK